MRKAFKPLPALMGGLETGGRDLLAFQKEISVENSRG